MKPQVSVIIVNYNAGDLLTDSVKSVIDFPGVEVVVADNASKDTSFSDLAKNIKRSNLILIDNHANIGFGKAVNQAVEKSHGKYVYLLNPDAELSKTALTRMVETAKNNDDRAIIAPRLENPDGTPQSSCYRPQTIWNAVKEYWFNQSGSYSKYLPLGKSPQRVYAAVAAAWLVPRTIWDQLGGLSPRFFLYFEDIDMCDRANQSGIPIIYDPQAVVKHAHGVSSRTNPIVLKLFTDSAWTYHGRFKKIVIDTIIHVRDLFIPPVSWKKVLGITILISLFYAGVAAIGYFLLPARYSPSALINNFYHSNFLMWSWANFDGEHFLNIAKNGYQTVLGQSEYAFFPLFPLLISTLNHLGLDLYLSAHLVSRLSAIGFIFILLRWAEKYLKNPLSLLWIILLSPGAIFLASIYTEPLFLFLTVLTFYFADRKEWGRATLTTALATATRVNGIFLVLFLLIKLFQNKKTFKSIFAYGVAALSGFAAYMTYLFIQTGDAIAFFHAQSGWQKSTATAPWVTLFNYGRSLTVDFLPDLTHLVVAVEVIVTTIIIYLLVHFWRQNKLSSAYKYYALGNLALPLITGSLGSMPRFSLSLFPIFLIIPSLPKVPRIIIISIFVACSILGIILFTRGFWYA